MKHYIINDEVREELKKIDQNKVEFKSSNKAGDCPGFLVKTGKKKGLVVLQEWWGVEEGILQKGKYFAAAGYETLVPDLYRGKVAKDHEEAGHHFGSLDWAGALQDIQGAVDFLNSEVGCETVGIIGFCMGGALALKSAMEVSGLNCAAFFYGIPSPVDATKIKIPIQGHFGNADKAAGFSDVAAVDELIKKLKDANVKDYSFLRHDNADHAFTNQDYHNHDRYNAEATAVSFKAVLEFFEKNL